MLKVVGPLAILFALTGYGRALEPLHYDVSATLDTGRNALAAAVVKIAMPAPDVRTVNEFLLGGTYTVTSIRAGPSATAEVSPTDNPFPGLQKITIRCSTPRHQGLRLEVRYTGRLTELSAPPMNAITPDLVELSLDSFWLPFTAGFNKFTVQAAIRGVPRDLLVVGPGIVRRSGSDVRIRRRTPDVDLAFVAARGLQRANADGFEFYSPDLGAKASQIYLRHGRAIVKFLENWFGTMPSRPVRLVVVRRERKSGYSRSGYIVMTESGLYQEAELAQFMAHEFAHAWWSPCDPRTEHRWLSESIAEYVALRYVETAFGPDVLEGVLAAKREAAGKAGPLLGAGERGDAELYGKGPLLLFDLETRIGRARMDSVLAGLAHHPPHVTAEFMNAVAAQAGETAATAFDKAMRQ